MLNGQATLCVAVCLTKTCSQHKQADWQLGESECQIVCGIKCVYGMCV